MVVKLKAFNLTKSRMYNLVAVNARQTYITKVTAKSWVTLIKCNHSTSPATFSLSPSPLTPITLSISHICYVKHLLCASYIKTFPTAASPFDIWVIENKLWLQFINDIVHFCPQQCQLCFWVDVDTNPWSKEKLLLNEDHSFTNIS